VSTNMLTTPLAEADLDRLELLLERVNPDSMTVDELDGFFCALVCGPGRQPVNKYFPDVLGQDLDHDSFRYSMVDPVELSTLLYRHWNEIAAAMLADKVYVPLFEQEEPGNPIGHNWARGFVHGMDFDSEAWDTLAKDKHDWALLAPMMLLLADSDPELAPELKRPVDTPEKRMDVLAATAASLSLLFRRFHPGSAKSPSQRQ